MVLSGLGWQRQGEWTVVASVVGMLWHCLGGGVALPACRRCQGITMGKEGGGGGGRAMVLLGT